MKINAAVIIAFALGLAIGLVAGTKIAKHGSATQTAEVAR